MDIDIDDQPVTTAQEEAVSVPIDWQAVAEKAAEQQEATQRAIMAALFPDGDGNLVRHARRELELAGLFDEDSDYGGMVAESVLDLIRVFASQGHSGGSAMMTIDLFRRLASFANLTPLTPHPGEWMHVGGEAPHRVYQSTRKSSTFWREGEPDWYDLDEPKQPKQPEMAETPA